MDGITTNHITGSGLTQQPVHTTQKVNRLPAKAYKQSAVNLQQKGDRVTISDEARTMSAQFYMASKTDNDPPIIPAATYNTVEIAALNSKIGKLKEEISTLRPRARFDENSEQQLTGKQAELVTLQMKLAQLKSKEAAMDSV